MLGMLRLGAVFECVRLIMINGIWIGCDLLNELLYLDVVYILFGVGAYEMCFVLELIKKGNLCLIVR